MLQTAPVSAGPRRVEGILENTLANESLLYVPDKDLAVSLNPSAKAVWELCDGSLSATGIAQAIGQRMGFSNECPPALIADVRHALEDLQALGLVDAGLKS